MQDMCDCTDTVSVYISRALELKTYNRYFVTYSVVEGNGMLVGNEYKQIVVKK